MRMDWIAFKGILVQGSNSNWNCALDISNYYNYQTINCLDMDHSSPTPHLFAKFHNLDLWVSVPSWLYLNIFVFLTWNLHGVQKKFLAEFGGRRWETKLSRLSGTVWANLGQFGLPWSKIWSPNIAFYFLLAIFFGTTCMLHLGWFQSKSARSKKSFNNQILRVEVQGAASQSRWDEVPCALHIETPKNEFWGPLQTKSAVSHLITT